MKIIVNVKPNSDEERIDKVGEEYIVRVKERAEDGKANRAVIKILCREFGVDFRKIIIKNPKSRRKIVEISD